MIREPSFSLKDFISYIDKNPYSETRIIVPNDSIKPGDKISVRLSETNMIKKLKSLNEGIDIEKISKDLKENGGIMEEIDGPDAFIKVLGTSSTMKVPRLFLRRKDKKQ